MNFNPDFAGAVHQFFDQIGVKSFQGLFAAIDYTNHRARPGGYVGELERNIPAADEQNPWREIFQLHELVGGNHMLSPRHVEGPGLGARGDQKMPGLQPGAVNLYGGRADETRGAAQGGAKGVRRILDDAKAMAVGDRADAVPIGQVADQVGHEHGRGVGRDQGLDAAGVDVIGAFLDVDEGRNETGAQ